MNGVYQSSPFRPLAIGRIRQNINVSGRDAWTLFDSCARNSYIVALGGGWAVWRHGFVGLVTEDMDVALPADRVEDFLRVATVSGFQVLAQPAGLRPKVLHMETDVKVDILPEGARPDTADRPAPTTIPHPARMGAAGNVLRYVDLPSIVELKLAAGRLRDHYDVTELIRANPLRVDELRAHLGTVHTDYAATFEQLLKQASEQVDH